MRESELREGAEDHARQEGRQEVRLEFPSEEHDQHDVCQVFSRGVVRVPKRGDVINRDGGPVAINLDASVVNIPPWATPLRSV